MRYAIDRLNAELVEASKALGLAEKEYATSPSISSAVDKNYAIKAYNRAKQNVEDYYDKIDQTHL